MLFSPSQACRVVVGWGCIFGGAADSPLQDCMGLAKWRFPACMLVHSRLAACFGSLGGAGRWALAPVAPALGRSLAEAALQGQAFSVLDASSG